MAAATPRYGSAQCMLSVLTLILIEALKAPLTDSKNRHHSNLQGAFFFMDC